MLRFTLELLIMVGGGLILYLVARALPRVGDTDTAVPHPVPVPHWVTAYLERIDERYLATFEKLLRRLRLWILKFDSKLTARLERFRKPASNGHPLLTGNGEQSSGSSSKAVSEDSSSGVT